MSELLEYECPACGGILEFDTDSQKLKCPYCDSMYDVDEYKKMMAEKEAVAEGLENSINTESEEWNDPNLLIYVCQSCGGEIIGDKTLGSTSCPFCGNNVVMTKQFTGALKPDYVIPFKLNKQMAKDALANHFKGKKLLNREFSSDNKLDEVKGVYVPFWIYNVDAGGDATFTATKVKQWNDSKYHYTETSYYRVERAGVASYSGVPADASTKMSDNLMDSIEPYDYSQAVPFNSAYLAGFLADKYDVEAKDNMERVRRRVANSLAADLRRTVNDYSSVSEEKKNIAIKSATAKYALLPVWVLTTKWKDQTYTFAMNGQTGKFVGNLPLDKGLYAKYLTLWTLLITIIGGTILFLFELI